MFHFSLPIEFVKILEKYDFTYHCSVREYVFQEAEQQFFGFNQYTFFSSGLCSALGKCTKFPEFLVFRVYSHNGSHWHHRLNKKQMPKPLPLNFCNCTLLSVFFVWGSAWITVQCIITAKVAYFLMAEPKPLEMESFILNPKIAVQPLEKPFHLHVNYYSFWVFKKTIDGQR